MPFTITAEMVTAGIVTAGISTAGMVTAGMLTDGQHTLPPATGWAAGGMAVESAGVLVTASGATGATGAATDGAE